MAGRRILAALAAMFLVILAFVAGYAAYPLIHAQPATVLAPQPAADAMANYWQVWSLLDRDFYGAKPDAEQRTYGAIAGMVQRFGDPYTFFVEPQPRELERDQLAGKFGGIGATLEQTAAGWLLHPLPAQPAAQAGILDGDRLLKVDGAPITATMSSEEIVVLVRGEPESQVTLVVERTPAARGAAEILTFTVTRAEIETPSIEWRLLDENPQTADVGYLRHTIFSERSAAEMRQAIQALQAAGATRYIWDLRGNPGGLLNIAVEMADLWLDEGVILIEAKADGLRKEFTATPGQLAANAPLVLVVDGGSASASEIVAGALHDHARARLIGSQTFGKGSVQLIHELSDSSSLHVTNAEWLTPSGRQISGQGLTPDVAVAEGDDPLAAAIAALPLVQEARK
ncbi:MAG: S41 family peptidase [Caldilineaceae bacterium]|jgi:carboxyl-terminal processing protease|nr:S41 family peptidase [Caldilineaceae bacterium]